MQKLFLDYNNVEQYVHSIINQMVLDNWRPEYVIGLTRGGLLPATLISHYFKVPMNALGVSLRDSNTVNESNCWMAEDALNGKRILVVDDINDTGETLQWIVNDWRSLCMPGSSNWDQVFGRTTRFATIVNNESSAVTDVSYTGLEINKAVNDVWIVFPWEEWWLTKSES